MRFFPCFHNLAVLFSEIVICRRAVARQPTILYNSEIWPKSVGCKIVDLRSRVRSLHPCACGFGDMRMSIPLYPGYACECTWKYRSISSNSRNQGLVNRGQFI